MIPMIVSGVSLITRIASSFARYRISSLGIKRFAGEVTGGIAISAAVDVAAEYNDWVKDNQETITLALLGMGMAHNSLLAALEKGVLKRASLLFSKFSLVNMGQTLAKAASGFTITPSLNGVKLIRNGELFLSITRGRDGLLFTHSGALTSAAILAAGFGGAIPRTREEWEMTGYQLAVQAADLELSTSDRALEERLTTLSPLTLFSHGSTYVESFLREHPHYPADLAVKKAMQTLITHEERKGSFAIGMFKDADGDDMVTINGVDFSFVEKGDAFILTPAEPAGDFTERSEFSEENRDLLGAVSGMLSKLSVDGKVTLVRIADTERFMSTPFTSPLGVVSAFAVDESMVPVIAVARDTLFDSAHTNLEDEFEETSIESMTRIGNSLLDWFSDDEEETAAAKQRIEKGELIPKSTQPGTSRHITDDSFVLTEEDFLACLGK